MTDRIDPTAPLRTIDGATIRQRVGGTLFVRWADGTEENFPFGFSVNDVEVEVRRRLREGGST